MSVVPVHVDSYSRRVLSWRIRKIEKIQSDHMHGAHPASFEIKRFGLSKEHKFKKNYFIDNNYNHVMSGVQSLNSN